ncbi:hypothetical protein X979_5829 [Burkholderia pseudomallei MSHR7527]|nr:hypothetical protein M218_27180 [Burkholderia pseudomallei MSHR338]KGC85636.1 hypothetical protein DO71_4948 [Burkholderia pseudomallei]KGS54711.1 hypothetical protein X949_5117 [Burkholderia pseudomallei MSHR5609]KGS71008.1 hypothetical protein X979_5829 [Burkholderia pseudomallei MSHR7527]KGS72954.1 hypothetical protein X942_5931 [Burkholderia pseudomallei MSHR5596]KGW74102.1 hypothetical protein Y046_6135 [Burkholderia pseudomallei MSHR2990]KGX51830.1 hypothetical protein Y027_5087 [Bur
MIEAVYLDLYIWILDFEIVYCCIESCFYCLIRCVGIDDKRGCIGIQQDHRDHGKQYCSP